MKKEDSNGIVPSILGSRCTFRQKWCRKACVKEIYIQIMAMATETVDIPLASE
jgi:hypothetical protein